MTTTTITPQLEDLADEYEQLEAQLAPMLARQEEIRKHFRQLQRGTHDIGSLSITVSANRRLNTKQLEATYTPDEYPELYVQKIDTKAAREDLGAEMLETFTSEGENKVSVKIP